MGKDEVKSLVLNYLPPGKRVLTATVAVKRVVVEDPLPLLTPTKENPPSNNTEERYRIRLRPGMRCLELDHIRPFGKGGSSDPENLRLLCPTHNRHAAELHYGKEYMRQFIT